MAHLIARTLALTLGMFTIINVVVGRVVTGFDVNHWWVDLRLLPTWLGQVLLFTFALFAIAFAVRPTGLRGRMSLTRGLFLSVLAMVVLNIATIMALQVRGSPRFGFGVPFSLGVLLVLVVMLWATFGRPKPLPRLYGAITASVVCGICTCLFAVAQMFCFGKTDYRRSADAIVVFGARAYADGRPSDALADRVRTACELYHQGLAARLIFSGGPGDGDIHETEAMRRFAIAHGVPDEAILLDDHGLNTRETARNTIAMFQAHGVERVLAVSHFYHLPRVKMTYQQEGFDVYTVPARERYTLRKTPILMLREVAALGVYYLAPLLRV